MYRAIIGLLVFIFFSGSTISQTKDLNDFGVEISFSAEKEIFPATWESTEINGKATSIDSTEIPRTTAILLKALNKYPAELVKKHLKKIYVVGQLEFYGQSYGGTNSTAEVYLTNLGKELGYSDFWIEQAFHSEFSSILLRSYSFLFDMKKWTSHNRKVQYGASGTEALKKGKASVDFDLELNKRGILCLYGTASVEEDFNSYAENLFLSRTGFWEIAKSQNRIKAKIDQVIDFYELIDGTFNEAYFKEISKK